MLKKLKITTCTFTLCLFGLTLITVSPVFAEDSPEFIACQQMKWKGGKKEKKNCFRDLARAELAPHHTDEIMKEKEEIELCMASLKEVNKRYVIKLQQCMDCALIMMDTRSCVADLIR